MQFDTDLLGGDLSVFNGSTPELCEAECKEAASIGPGLMSKLEFMDRNGGFA
jgi:hypothetical protein